MSQDILFSAALSLLSEGGYIEQVTANPLAFRLVFEGDSVPLSGGIVQRLQNGRHIREGSSLNGRKRFYAKKGF
ncbi:hypothetical protein [Acidithiobacillus concretivorus]|uniref:Uncharacterized protein n=1 Tax=Acidithiobacillus concretivorus TaxID=3063952 RepID=A0ABS5ZRB7_9PROT|nr:hypothetical protein [Acidithiobacillus concretivorus]MBU2738692.1 hypothetical protein [Acidithiobacillus concretivorus]